MAHNPLPQLRKRATKSFSGAPVAIVTLLFIVVAVVALYFAFFVRGSWPRAVALAYFLLP